MDVTEGLGGALLTGRVVLAVVLGSRDLVFPDRQTLLGMLLQIWRAVDT